MPEHIHDTVKVNQIKNVQLRIILYILILLIPIIGYSQNLKKNSLSIGESFQIDSKVLKESRTINVFLPTSYNPDSLDKYNVIYLLDGSIDEDFIHVVGNVQFCSFSWINIIPESIVVGIANIDRKRDFTYPSNFELDRTEFPTSGKSSKFIEFISNELQPTIRKNYRCNNETTIIGQSLGGLLATQILFENPELFTNYIIISPSLWWDEERMLKQNIEHSLKDKSIYIGVGNEGPTMNRLAQTLYNKLSIEKGKEAKLYFNYLEKQNHGDALHLAVYDAFEQIFKEKKSKKD